MTELTAGLAAAALAAATGGAGFAAGRLRGWQQGRHRGAAEAALALRERALTEAGCPVCGASPHPLRRVRRGAGRGADGAPRP